eukprot:TRINITY_DN34369_c0_g1_i1.p1 TRINITY_DN34369_c0_g1~~TRINITY_DN34369_c0_g1_i1.p1  ORF type:complete len:232 (+),score=60.37 TRINITY_DN34369_c0_g1_i1:105-698(+)
MQARGGCAEGVARVEVAAAPGPAQSMPGQSLCGGSDYVVSIHGEHLKFSCAHFVAYKGFRERLHGHNYTLQVRLAGPVGADGYVIDFGDMKAIAKQVCRELHEHMLVPMRSDVLTIGVADGQLSMRCEDGATFSFPAADCAELPIVHSTAEELAAYLADRIVGLIGPEKLQQRSLRWMEVSVSERPTQMATHCRSLC